MDRLNLLAEDSSHNGNRTDFYRITKSLFNIVLKIVLIFQPIHKIPSNIVVWITYWRAKKDAVLAIKNLQA